MASTLPPEILRQIFTPLREAPTEAGGGYKPLLPFLLVCRSWHNVARAVLWNHLVLTQDTIPQFIAAFPTSKERAEIPEILSLTIQVKDHHPRSRDGQERCQTAGWALFAGRQRSPSATIASQTPEVTAAEGTENSSSRAAAMAKEIKEAPPPRHDYHSLDTHLLALSTLTPRMIFLHTFSFNCPSYLSAPPATPSCSSSSTLTTNTTTTTTTTISSSSSSTTTSFTHPTSKSNLIVTPPSWGSALIPLLHSLPSTVRNLDLETNEFTHVRSRTTHLQLCDTVRSLLTRLQNLRLCLRLVCDRILRDPVTGTLVSAPALKTLAISFCPRAGFPQGMTPRRECRGHGPTSQQFVRSPPAGGPSQLALSLREAVVAGCFPRAEKVEVSSFIFIDTWGSTSTFIPPYPPASNPLDPPYNMALNSTTTNGEEEEETQTPLVIPPHSVEAVQKLAETFFRSTLIIRDPLHNKTWTLPIKRLFGSTSSTFVFPRSFRRFVGKWWDSIDSAEGCVWGVSSYGGRGVMPLAAAVPSDDHGSTDGGRMGGGDHATGTGRGWVEGVRGLELEEESELRFAATEAVKRRGGRGFPKGLPGGVEWEENCRAEDFFPKVLVQEGVKGMVDGVGIRRNIWRNWPPPGREE